MIALKLFLRKLFFPFLLFSQEAVPRNEIFARVIARKITWKRKITKRRLLVRGENFAEIMDR